MAAGLTVLVTGATDGLEEAAPDPIAYDAAARRRLWDVSERLTRG